jgi:hypothetical protein
MFYSDDDRLTYSKSHRLELVIKRYCITTIAKWRRLALDSISQVIISKKGGLTTAYRTIVVTF